MIQIESNWAMTISVALWHILEVPVDINGLFTEQYTHIVTLYLGTAFIEHFDWLNAMYLYCLYSMYVE